MNRAVNNRRLRVSRKKAVIIVILATGIAVAASTLAFERGPYFCESCSVASPVPDASTLELIKDSRAPVDYVPLFAWASGTTYQICNSTHCTTYHENFEGNWVGEGRITREGDPGGGGGGDFGGGGGGHWGDWDNWGGGGGGGGGRIDVGPVEQA